MIAYFNPVKGLRIYLMRKYLKMTVKDVVIGEK